MPIPSKKSQENKKDFLSRCMGDETMKQEYPEAKQRVAICLSQTKSVEASLVEEVHDIIYCANAWWDDDWDEFLEDVEITQIFDEDGHLVAAEHQGKKVTLNKPFRTPDGPKKFAVYVKNGSGKVIIVRFGDPNMKIKKNIPERRKSFRARHKCDQAKDKTTPRYWSCKMW